jgi:hypothetical protein
VTVRSATLESARAELLASCASGRIRGWIVSGIALSWPWTGRPASLSVEPAGAGLWRGTFATGKAQPVAVASNVEATDAASALASAVALSAARGLIWTWSYIRMESPPGPPSGWALEDPANTVSDLVPPSSFAKGVPTAVTASVTASAGTPAGRALVMAQASPKPVVVGSAELFAGGASVQATIPADWPDPTAVIYLSFPGSPGWAASAGPPHSVTVTVTSRL